MNTALSEFAQPHVTLNSFQGPIFRPLDPRIPDHRRDRPPPPSPPIFNAMTQRRNEREALYQVPGS